ncbi:MAG: 2,3,4,5-tetrahydropyridine-2,6-dicarboxylate N-succinyltransferase, partial [Solirubrobacterales bacterium]
MSTGSASAVGLATLDGAEPIEVYFPSPRLGGDGEPGWRELGRDDGQAGELAAMAGEDEILGTRRVSVAVNIADLSSPPESVPDAYLRLHLLSHRLVAPRGLNVDGLLGLLPNVAWTSLGPVAAGAADGARQRAMAGGRRLDVRSVDKVPRMTDSVVPPGVRIADADRVRLGAHLAEGTTVMHEGFVNFNAGTLGPSMVEGRISAGVVVGAGSDLGGGASVMGTLSGGGSEVI